jgi:hypothetical protein
MWIKFGLEIKLIFLPVLNIQLEVVAAIDEADFWCPRMNKSHSIIRVFTVDPASARVDLFYCEVSCFLICVSRDLPRIVVLRACSSRGMPSLIDNPIQARRGVNSRHINNNKTTPTIPSDALSLPMETANLSLFPRLLNSERGVFFLEPHNWVVFLTSYLLR